MEPTFLHIILMQMNVTFSKWKERQQLQFPQTYQAH